MPLPPPPAEGEYLLVPPSPRGRTACPSHLHQQRVNTCWFHLPQHGRTACCFHLHHKRSCRRPPPRHPFRCKDYPGWRARLGTINVSADSISAVSREADGIATSSRRVAGVCHPAVSIAADSLTTCGPLEASGFGPDFVLNFWAFKGGGGH